MNKIANKKHIGIEVIALPSESHSIYILQFIDPHLQVVVAVSVGQGLWLLLPAYYPLSGTPLGHPIVVLCRRDPVALDL